MSSIHEAFKQVLEQVDYEAGFWILLLVIVITVVFDAVVMMDSFKKKEEINDLRYRLCQQQDSKVELQMDYDRLERLYKMKVRELRRKRTETENRTQETPIT